MTPDAARAEATINPDTSLDQDYRQGLAYSLGDGVDADPLKALEHFLRAAERGHAGAQYQLGLAYAYGKGTQQNPSQAADWYQRAAVKGHATAQRNLGMMYLDGDGVAVNRPLALAWYSILAEDGSPLDGKRRDLLREGLSREEIKEAEKLQGQLRETLQIERQITATLE